MKIRKYLPLVLTACLLTACGGGTGASFSTTVNSAETGSGSSNTTGNTGNSTTGSSHDSGGAATVARTELQLDDAWELSHWVTEAEYSESLESLITIDSNNQMLLYKLDPVNRQETSVQLASHPTRLALSPDGTKALVSHKWANTVSYVDLENMTLIATFDVGDHGDVAVDNNDNGYLAAKSLYRINLQTGETFASESTYEGIVGGRYLQYAPGLNAIYGGAGATSAQNTKRYDVSGALPEYVTNSTQQNDYALTVGVDGIWLTEDETYLVDSHRYLFRISGQEEEDLKFLQKLPQPAYSYSFSLVHADHSQEANKLVELMRATTTDGSHNTVYRFYTLSGNDENTATLTQDYYFDNGTETAGRISGKFVFFDSTGATRHTVVTQNSTYYLHSF